MKNKIAIYLAGSIKKGHEKVDESFWTQEDRDIISDHLPTYDVSFLNPAIRSDDLSDQRSVFGRDMLQVFSSHFVFVDARDRRGLGVGAEMMWAKCNRIPLLIWAPKDSHYSKRESTVLGVTVKNWVHPFVECLGDKIVENLAEGAAWIDHVMTSPSISIKGIDSIHSAMDHYKQTQLHNDLPMQELLALNDKLFTQVR